MDCKFIKADIGLFEEIYSIMDYSFPDEEMRPKDVHYNTFLHDKHYSTYCAIGDDNEILGFIVVWELGDFIFFENFAIAKEHRSKGIGSALLQYVLKLYNCPAVLEVEPPVDEITKKRVAFYERNGFVFNDFVYYLPPLRPGSDYMRLYIMSHKEPMTKESFEPFRKKIYDIVYNKPDDYPAHK